MTELKSIWHTSNEKPEQLRYYLEEYDKFSDGIGYLVNKRYGVVNTIDDLTTKRWCYVDDLLALETENKDLSDKIGKLKYKLDIAVDALIYLGNYAYDIDEHIFIEKTLEQINQKEEK